MVKVFSFCLYGPPNPRYYPLSILQNISLIATHYPGWKVYLYTAPDVDQSFLDQVASHQNVALRPTGKLGSINMVERFFAIDEPDVETMFVRDADSHVHWKDRWAINDFLQRPKYSFHIIRDNLLHASRIMGGMWGMHKSANLSIRGMYDLYLQNPFDWGIGYDQNFLSGYVYPYVRAKALVHFSNRQLRDGETGIPFPFVWSNDVYCGRCDDATVFVDTAYVRPPIYPFLKFS